MAPVILNGAPVTQNGAPVIFNRALVTQNGAPVIFNGAPVTQDGSPVILNGAPVIFNGAPVTQNGTPVILNGAPKCSELKPVVVNGTTVIFDRVPDSLEGAPVTVNEAPNALDGRPWYKIPHLWFFKDVAGLHRALFVEKKIGRAQLVIGGALGTIGGARAPPIARAPPKRYKVPPVPVTSGLGTLIVVKQTRSCKELKMTGRFQGPNGPILSL